MVFVWKCYKVDWYDNNWVRISLEYMLNWKKNYLYYFCVDLLYYKKNMLV